METPGVDPALLNLVAVPGSTNAVVSAERAGLGYCFVSQVDVKEEIRFSIMGQIPFSGFAGGERVFQVVAHRKRNLSTPYRAFHDYLTGGQVGVTGAKEP